MTFFAGSVCSDRAHKITCPGDLVTRVLSRVISTLNGVTPNIAVLITDLQSPLGLKVQKRKCSGSPWRSSKM